MYKVKELIDKGLDIPSLPEDVQKDIENIRRVSENFTKESETALELDKMLHEKIITEYLFSGAPIETGEKISIKGNPFIGDAYFNANPDSVLGEQTKGGKFGDSVIVKGNPEAIGKIEVMMPEKVFRDFPEDITMSGEKIGDKIKESVKKTEETIVKEKDRKITRLITMEESEAPQVLSFRDVVEKYNKNISPKELEAFLYSRPDLPSQKYIDKFENSIESLIKEGYLYWDEKLEYVHVFACGDVREKRTRTVRDKELIIEKFGEDFYNSQLKFIDDNMPTKIGIKITDEKNTESLGIDILPHSEFSKTFVLMYKECLFLMKDDDETETTLFNIFSNNYLDYINRTNPGLFSGSNYSHIRNYIIGKKIKFEYSGSDKDKKKEEKEQRYAWQKAKEIGDKLFLKMLDEELNIDAKKRFEILWNEKYNTFKLPDYSKIPVGFSMSKFFLDKELELNTTQRESAAFYNYIKSGCFAQGVGLGKTIGSIVTMAQSMENGKAERPLLIVPNNVYEKWIRDIEGYYSDELGRQFIGVLHHYPKMRRLYNLTPEIVFNSKIYTEEEKSAIETAIEKFEIVREQKKEIIETNDIPQKLFNIIDNPYAAIAIEAFDMAQKHIDKILAKLKKDFDVAMGKSLSDEARKRYTNTFEQRVEEVQKQKPKTFANIYYNLVKDEHIFLIYTTGYFPQVDPGTITIITHDALQMNLLGIKNSEMLIERLYSILSQGDRFDDPREATALYEKIVERVESVVGNAKVFIEDLGIDFLVIDEAHAFKKIFTSLKGEVKTDSSGEIVQTEKTIAGQKRLYADREFNYYELDYGQPSGRALSAYFLTQYIQIIKNGANTLLMTATPFENSPLEIYSMLSMSNHAVLQSYGFSSIKDFFDTFMKIVYDFKVKINGVERDTVLNGFVNLPQLRTLVRNIILHRTGEQVEGLIRPDKVVLPLTNSDMFDNIHEIETMLVPTDEQRDLIKKIEAYIAGTISLNELQFEEAEGYLLEEMIREEEELIKEQFSSDDPESAEAANNQRKNIKIDTELQTESEMEGTRIIQGINMIKQITFSPYMLKLRRETGIMPTAEQFVETSPKLKYIMECVKSVKKHHESKGTPVSGQIIYLTWGKSFFPLIKEYLTKPAFGITFAEDEVQAITGELSKNKKEKIKKLFNDGKIKVLIATKSIQVGADLQKKSSALYHGFYDWNPTDAEQINGRVWRQGNMFMAVRIVYPIVQNSVDPVIFQYLQDKTDRIKDVWDMASIKSQLDLTEFDPKKLKTAAISDPEKRAKLQLSIEKELLNEKLSYYRNIINPLKNVPYILDQFKESLEKIPALFTKFFIAKQSYINLQLLNEKSDKEYPVKEELEKLTKPIDALREKIPEIEAPFDEKIEVLKSSIENVEAELAAEQARIKSEITDAVLADATAKVKELKKQYDELPKIYRKKRKAELESKISKLEKEKNAATEKINKQIGELSEKIKDKQEKIKSRLDEITARYEKKMKENDDYYNDKINRLDPKQFESRKEYLTYLYSTCTEVIKFIDTADSESGWTHSIFDDIRYKSYTYRLNCVQFKQYRDEYYRIVKIYLEPMSIKEEDALQVVQKYQEKINEIIEQINNIDERYAEFYQKFEKEYMERLAKAKTPKQAADDFAQLNFLLDHVRIDIEAKEEIEEILPEEIETITPEISEEKAEGKVEVKMPDEKYILGKIKIFERMLKTDIDEKTRKYITAKIKIFNRFLKSMSPEVVEMAKGGLIGSKKVCNYVDLVDEGLMSRKDFVVFMHQKGDNILPVKIFDQIKACGNYDLILDILKLNKLMK